MKQANANGGVRIDVCRGRKLRRPEAMTFNEAKRCYVHRYTMEFVPNWAKVAAPNGKYYAPQYTSDREWFEHTLFPPNHPLGKNVSDCYSTGPTFPLGTWLDTPYE